MTDRIEGAYGHDFSELADVLRARRTRYVYIPNPGNAGDALIAVNTFFAFRALGIKFDIGHVSGVYPGRDVLYPGGGNLIAGYKPARNFFDRNHKVARSITLLPHSVHGHEDLLEALDGHITLFAREAPTLEYLKAAAPKAEVRFCHDMAFFAGPKATEAQPLALTREIVRDWRHPGILRYHREIYAKWRKTVATRDEEFGTGAAPGAPALHAFRTDDERTDIAVPFDNVDLSERFALPGHLRPPLANAMVCELIDAIAPFSTIRTNRLHIAILSAMLGKFVEVSDNSYGKLSAVHAASMTRGEFPNLKFVAPPEATSVTTFG